MILPPNLAQILSAEEIEDSETETFLLFAQPKPSCDLGFVDKSTSTLALSIAGVDLSIHQSPTLLASNRAEGTTGAVCWQITPLVASWMVSADNLLFKSGILSRDATVLELGCGTSAVLPVMLAPLVDAYVATDLEYVINGNLLRRNFAENERVSKPKSKVKPRGTPVRKQSNVEFLALDWEVSDIADLPKHCTLISGSVDVVIACDCIYNEALIAPFIRACADICRLKARSSGQPTVCVVAQQLRSDTVFCDWMTAFHERFRVWRVPDELLTKELASGSGFCIHIGILREP